MSRKRGKKQKTAVEAVPDDILAEGSGPARTDADAISTVEDVVTTDDIATTEDVVTADDVVATTGEPEITAVDGAGAKADAAPEGELGDGFDGDELDGDELDAAGPEDGIEGDRGEADDESADEGEVFPTSAATMDAVQLKHLVEALIFAADRPLTVPRLRQLTRVGDVRRLEQALATLSEDYRDRGLILQQVSGGYQFRTRTQFSAWVQQLIAGRPVRLSRAQLETLAIIAYRQPITRPEIDDIRGVDSSATLKLLIDRMLIRVLGKREEVGRPILYGTTKEFLDFFSLGDLRELPTLREYSELTAESRKVMSDRLGVPSDPEGGNGSGDGGHGSNGSNGAGSNGHGDHGGLGGNGAAGGHGGLAGADAASDSVDAERCDGADLGDAGERSSSPDVCDGEMLVDGELPWQGAQREGAEEPADDAELGDAEDGTAPVGADERFEHEELSDEEAPPPSVRDLADAVATFLSAADAVERSNAAAIAEGEDDADAPPDLAE